MKRLVLAVNLYLISRIWHSAQFTGKLFAKSVALDMRCEDKNKKEGTLYVQVRSVWRNLFNEKTRQVLSSSIAQWAFLTFILGSVIAAVLFLIYLRLPLNNKELDTAITLLLVETFFFILIIVGIVSWLFTMARKSTQSALYELREKASALAIEVKAHEKTSKAYQLAIETAESSNQAKSRYLTSLSHELRTPLNVLLGYAQLLSKDATLNPETSMAIKTMKRNGEHLGDLIEGILEVSKIEAGRLSVHRDEVQLLPLLEQLVSMFKLQAVSKGLQFHFDIPKYLPDYVTVDKQRLRQVLINLISNAIKFTQQGNIHFEMRYRNEVGYFTIKDTGPGISIQNQEQIFKPFVRVTEMQSTTSGTGLGLTISRGLAELMGGDISVTSEVGKGSCFKLSLFLPKITFVTTESISEKSIKHYEGPQKTILVVDDEASQRELIRDIMTPVGFQVIPADSAFAAMAILNYHAIDLILLDLNMPDIDGWQAAKQIRGENFKQPIMVISANVRDLEVSNTAEGHHNDYLVKPFAINSLLEKVGHWLNLTWVYEKDEFNTDTPTVNGLLIGKNQYRALKVLAEIGYLSGFISKLNKINQEYTIPDGIFPMLRDYAQQCQFKKIIQKLEELLESSDTKK